MSNYVKIDGCLYNTDDIQCILNISGEYPYEVYFIGGNSVYVDEDTGTALMSVFVPDADEDEDEIEDAEMNDVE